MSFRSSFRSGAVVLAVCAGCSVAGWSRAAEPVAVPDPQGAATPASAKPAAEDNLEMQRPAINKLQDRIPHKPETLESLFGSRRQAATPLEILGPTGRRKSLLDDESEWAFLTPQEVMNDYVMREVLKVPQYGPDGQDLSRLTPVERYYERLKYEKMRRDGRVTPLPGYDLLSFLGNPKPEAQPREEDNSQTVAAFLTQTPPQLVPKSALSAEEYAVSGRRPETLLDLLKPNRKPEVLPDVLVERKAQSDQIEAMKKIWAFAQPGTAPSAMPGLAMPGGPSGVPASIGSLGRVESLPGIGLRDPLSTIVSQYSPPLAPMAPLLPSAPKAPLPPGQVDVSSPAATPAPSKVQPSKPAFVVPQRPF